VAIILKFVQRRKIAKKALKVKDFDSINHGEKEPGGIMPPPGTISGSNRRPAVPHGGMTATGGLGHRIFTFRANSFLNDRLPQAIHLLLDTRPSPILYSAQLKQQEIPGNWIVAARLFALPRKCDL